MCTWQPEAAVERKWGADGGTLRTEFPLLVIIHPLFAFPSARSRDEGVPECRTHKKL